MSPSVKIFEDPVHGHITIPSEYCQTLIDTLLFQRLRRVEQTSMRTIFPSARHDRFVHSLGTLHVGSKLFDSLKKNTRSVWSEESYNSISELKNRPELKDFGIFHQFDENFDSWDLLQNTYQTACVTHDCCHAPFSHTFEYAYIGWRNAEELRGMPLDELLSLPLYANLVREFEDCAAGIVTRGVQTEIVAAFKQDLYYCGAKPHEVASAWLLLHKQGFRKQLLSAGIKANPLLAARMILGCKYRDENGNESSVESEQLLNCFISLLNGHDIDADRLDYAARDQWAAGLHTPKMNLGRLLSSIFITRHDKSGRYIVCFKKQGITELQVLLDAKNHNDFWIFSHHKIKYHEELLVKAVKRLAILMSGDSAILEYQKKKKWLRANPDDTTCRRELDGQENEALFRLFNSEHMVAKRLHTFQLDGREQSESLYLLSDDDIIHLLKKYFCVEQDYDNKLVKEFIEESAYAQEWLGRKQVMIPLWKTYSEYNALYRNKFGLEARAIERFEELLTKELQEREKRCAEKGEPAQPLTMADCEALLDRDTEIQRLAKKLAPRVLCVRSVAARYAQHLASAPSEAPGKMYLDLEKAFTYFSLDTRINKTMSDIAHATLLHFHDEGYCMPHHEIKSIPVKHLRMKEIEADKVYVEIKGKHYCYTDLNIPQRNRKGDFKFVYLYVPKGKLPNGMELTRENYASKMQEMLNGYNHEIAYNTYRHPESTV